MEEDNWNTVGVQNAEQEKDKIEIEFEEQPKKEPEIKLQEKEETKVEIEQEDEPVNKRNPEWRKSSKELTDQDCIELYKYLYPQLFYI